jgi:hypothetical protein
VILPAHSRTSLQFTPRARPQLDISGNELGWNTLEGEVKGGGAMQALGQCLQATPCMRSINMARNEFEARDTKIVFQGMRYAMCVVPACVSHRLACPPSVG